jgi:hypothetical protein
MAIAETDPPRSALQAADLRRNGNGRRRPALMMQCMRQIQIVAL